MKSHHTSLFLIELIIAIFFFLISSTLCVELFAKSDTMNKQSYNLTQGVRLSSNIAEMYKADTLTKYYPQTITYFNEDWKKSSSIEENKIIYKEKKKTLTIQVFNKGKKIYSIDVRKGSE